MNNKQADELFKKILEDETIREELEKRNPELVAGIAGYLLSSWLPSDIWRRVLMFGFLTAAVLLAIFAHPLYLLLGIFAAMFSPRMMGETFGFFGRFRQH
jgi:hypothetical protein